jgi:hypothetical protein
MDMYYVHANGSVCVHICVLVHIRVCVCVRVLCLTRRMWAQQTLSTRQYEIQKCVNV